MRCSTTTSLLFFLAPPSSPLPTLIPPSQYSTPLQTFSSGIRYRLVRKSYLSCPFRLAQGNTSVMLDSAAQNPQCAPSSPDDHPDQSSGRIVEANEDEEEGMFLLRRRPLSIRPTKISGPLPVKTSRNRHRRGHRDGFPGRGSLGQMKPSVEEGILLFSRISVPSVEFEGREKNRERASWPDVLE